MERNSLPRWLISMTLMPLPCQSSISAATRRSTGSGRVAGPGAKLNGRDEVIDGRFAAGLLLRGGGGGCLGRSGRLRCNAELLGKVGLQRLEAAIQSRARFAHDLLYDGLLQFGVCH